MSRTLGGLSRRTRNRATGLPALLAAPRRSEPRPACRTGPFREASAVRASSTTAAPSRHSAWGRGAHPSQRFVSVSYQSTDGGGRPMPRVPIDDDHRVPSDRPRRLGDSVTEVRQTSGPALTPPAACNTSASAAPGAWIEPSLSSRGDSYERSGRDHHRPLQDGARLPPQPLVTAQGGRARRPRVRLVDP